MQSICAEAARAGDLETLTWARVPHCAWLLDEVLNIAAQGGHMHVLQWLHCNSERPWTHDEQARMLSAAGMCSDLTAAKWLQANGAAWPDCFSDVWPDTSSGEPNPWPVATVQWALVSGCSWGHWECEAIDTQPFYNSETDLQRRTRELFDWAHDNGCPCRCGESFSDSD
jgi:hypothetical protein